MEEDVMRYSIGDLRRVQEGLLQKLIAAGDAGLSRSQLLNGSNSTTNDKRSRSLRRLELAGMIRAERVAKGYRLNGSRRHTERWFALVDDPALERGLNADGEPYAEGARFD
jgi:hypothetical protein